MSMSPSGFKTRLEARRGVLTDLIRGLEGSTFEWGEGAAKARQHILKELGVTLVTRSRAKKLGYEINPRSKPVGVIYYGAPISQYGDVYILECQCYKTNPGGALEGET